MQKVLTGHTCLVVGATGNIGRGAVKAFLNHDPEKVVITGREKYRLEKLATDYLDNDSRLRIVEADFTDATKARHSTDAIMQEVEKLDHVVSSSGPWWSVGSLYDLDPAIWGKAFQANLFSHFYAYRYLNPYVRQDGSYVIVNGAAAVHLPQTGLTGICAYGLGGLCKVLMQEGLEAGIRVHELLLHLRVADRPPNPGMKSEVFGEVFAAIAADKGGFAAGATIEIKRENQVTELTQALQKAGMSN